MQEALAGSRSEQEQVQRGRWLFWIAYTLILLVSLDWLLSLLFGIGSQRWIFVPDPSYVRRSPARSFHWCRLRGQRSLQSERHNQIRQNLGGIISRFPSLPPHPTNAEPGE